MEEYLFLSCQNLVCLWGGGGVGVGEGGIAPLAPGSAGPLRVIVVGVKRDFVEFF